MKISKSFLFATDLSDDCQRSYNYALNMIMSCNGSLILLHVMENIEASIEDRVRTLFGEERFERIMLEQKKDTRSILIGKRKEYQILEGALSRFCEEQASGEFQYLTPDEIIVKQGDIVEEILSTAQENESEMIILSQHKKDISEQSISQTIKDVVIRTPIPILIIPPQD